jgi:hypothetical protein
LRHGFGLTYREFYEHLVRFGAEGGRPLLGLLTAEGREAADTICAGGAPARCLDWTGALVWNPEEVAFLSAVRRKIELAEDLVAFGQQLQPVVGAGLTDQLLEDLVRLQLAALVGPGEATSATVALNHDLMTTVEEGYLGRSTPIRAMAPAVVTLSCDVPPMADIQEYALEMLRYGRKDNHLRRRPAPVATP